MDRVMQETATMGVRVKMGPSSARPRTMPPMRTAWRTRPETIKAYIENQKWDEDDQGFKITAPTEP